MIYFLAPWKPATSIWGKIVLWNINMEEGSKFKLHSILSTEWVSLLPHWKVKINVSGTIVSEKYPALGINYVALRWLLYFIELAWTSDTLISELKFKKAPLTQVHAHTNKI